MNDKDDLLFMSRIINILSSFCIILLNFTILLHLLDFLLFENQFYLFLLILKIYKLKNNFH
jgi:hypothetical protein